MGILDFGILNKEKPEDFLEQEGALPVKKDPFDPKPLTELFAKFVDQISEMDTKAQLHEVTDEITCKEANEMTNQAAKLVIVIEKKRKQIKEPYLKVTSALDSFASGLKKGLLSIQECLKQEMLPYTLELDRKRKEDEAKLAAESKAAQDKLDAEAKKERDRIADNARQQAIDEGEFEEAVIEQRAEEAISMVDKAPVVVTQTSAIPSRIETESGTAKLKTEWDWKITDFKALPADLFEDRKDEIIKAIAPWINARMKIGMRNISGVEFFETTKLKTSTRR